MKGNTMTTPDDMTMKQYVAWRKSGKPADTPTALWDSMTERERKQVAAGWTEAPTKQDLLDQIEAEGH